MWKQQHVVGHHIFTNVNSEDPDVSLRTARLTPWQPHAPHHTLQHIYLGALYGLLSIKTILMSDFQAHAAGNIGPVQLSKLHNHETATLYAGKLIFAFWYFVAPLVWGSWDVLHLAGLWAVSQLVTGWTLALMFQVRNAAALCYVTVIDLSLHVWRMPVVSTHRHITVTLLSQTCKCYIRAGGACGG